MMVLNNILGILLRQFPQGNIAALAVLNGRMWGVTKDGAMMVWDTNVPLIGLEKTNYL